LLLLEVGVVVHIELVLTERLVVGVLEAIAQVQEQVVAVRLLNLL
jgi:hypothetical protein